MLPGERELWILKRFLIRQSAGSNNLSERQTANEVGTLAGRDQFAATRTAALLDTLIAQQVTVPGRTTQELSGACLLEAFCDGFACLLHRRFLKTEESTGFHPPCKEEKGEISPYPQKKSNCNLTGEARKGRENYDPVIASLPTCCIGQRKESSPCFLHDPILSLVRDRLGTFKQVESSEIVIPARLSVAESPISLSALLPFPLLRFQVSALSFLKSIIPQKNDFSSPTRKPEPYRRLCERTHSQIGWLPEASPCAGWA